LGSERNVIAEDTKSSRMAILCESEEDGRSVGEAKGRVEGARSVDITCDINLVMPILGRWDFRVDLKDVSRESHIETIQSLKVYIESTTGYSDCDF